jgi:hypothetical protein
MIYQPAEFSHMLSRTIILVLGLSLCLSNRTPSVFADEQPPTALDWRLHLDVDKLTDEKTLIASTEYSLGGYTIKITFSCVQQPELRLPLGPRPGAFLEELVKLPLYVEVTRYKSAAPDSCKDVGFRKSETLKYGVSDFFEYRIDDGHIWSVKDASRYCNTAKLVFGGGLDKDKRTNRRQL